MARPEPGERLIQQQRCEAARRFPETWAAMIAAWHQPGAQDCAWLMYSANYLFRTQGVRWAIDPVRLQHRLSGAPSPNYPADLAPLSFILLTHQHGDHLDLELIRSLRHLHITWIVPAALLPRLTEQAGIPASAILTAQPLRPVDLYGLRLTPFEALHWEKDPALAGEQLRGVPEMGYLVEFAGKRWLFPGDTRAYDASLLPALGPVDGLFAHVWLGRAAALRARPPLLDAFCRFCLDLQPRRILLTHLHEFARSPEEYWDERHAQLIAAQIHQARPGLHVEPARMGEKVLL